VEECQRRIECLAGARFGASRAAILVRGEGRRVADGLEEPLRCRGGGGDVDVLARRAADEVAQPELERSPARTAATKDDGDTGASARRSLERGEHPAFERWTFQNHHRPDPPPGMREGMSMPV